VKAIYEKILKDAEQDRDDWAKEGVDLDDIPEFVRLVESCETLKKYVVTIKEQPATREKRGGSDIIDASYIFSTVQDEIEGAEKYYNLYVRIKQEGQDKERIGSLQAETLKQMAKDEVRHADTWLKLAQEQGLDQSKVAQLKQRLSAVMSKLRTI